MSDELEDSITTHRANASRRFNPSTDLTSFVWCIPVERDSGSGVYFDGLDTNGVNVSIELRGASIFQGPTNTYFRPIANNDQVSPGPILVMVEDTHWLFSARNGGDCHYSTNRDYIPSLNHLKSLSMYFSDFIFFN